MTPTEALYADLRSRGIDFETDGQRLRWRPTFMVSPRDALLLAHHRPAVIHLLTSGWTAPACPVCRRTLDSAGRCPRCFDRPCVVCGRMTGSYCIQRCVACGYAFTRGVSTTSDPDL